MAERERPAVAAELPEERVARQRASLQAMSGWAVPVQWFAVVVTGGGALFLALSGRWQGWDWLFVVLCAFYVVNAVGFRWLLRRKVR